jgi:hypothetical protein
VSRAETSPRCGQRSRHRGTCEAVIHVQRRVRGGATGMPLSVGVGAAEENLSAASSGNEAGGRSQSKCSNWAFEKAPLHNKRGVETAFCGFSFPAPPPLRFLAWLYLCFV